jgi:tetratricopeptide (TPR) repeat protein
LDEWLARRHHLVLGALVVCAVAVRLLVWLQLENGPLVRIHQIHEATDSHFFSRWADHLRERDWLQHEPLHPITPWMAEAAANVMRAHPDLPVRLGLASDTSYDRPAMVRALWTHWLGGAAYFQEPLYPYLVALTRLVTGTDVRAVFAWQAALGVVTIVLVYHLGLKLFGATAGLAAAVLGICYAVIVVHEFALLRDSLIAFLTVALVASLVAALERGGWRWASFGLLAGLAVLAKVPFIVFVGLAMIGAVASRRCGLREAGLVALSAGLAVLPALVRNALVGVPLLQLNGSGGAMLPLFHMEGARAYQFSPDPRFAEVLARADARFLPSLLEAIRTHASLLDYLRQCLEKLAYAWHGAEIPNNVDPALFLQASSTLRALAVPFWVLGALGAVGLVATRAKWRRLWPLYAGLAACFPTLLLTAVLSRYRLPLAVALLPLAGAGAVAIAEWAAARRWGALAAVAALAVPYALWATRPVPTLGGAYYHEIGTVWLRNGQPALAALHFQEALRLEPDDTAARLGLGSALLADGRREEGLAALRGVLADEPPGSRIRQQTERLLNAAGGC